jgi:hypothetical protein
MCNPCKAAHPSNGTSAVRDMSHTKRGIITPRVRAILMSLIVLAAFALAVALVLWVESTTVEIAQAIGVLTALANFGI